MDLFRESKKLLKIVCSFDENLRILKANKTFKSFSVPPGQPLEGQSLFSFLEISPPQQHELLKNVKANIGNEPIHFNAAIKNHGSGGNQFYWIVKPVGTKADQPASLFIIGVNLSKDLISAHVNHHPCSNKRKPEMAILENVLFLDSLFEGVVLFNKDGEIIYANKASESILGLSNDQIKGRTTWDPRWNTIYEDGTPFKPYDHPSMITLRTGVPCKNILMGVSKPDSEVSWISINSQPIFIAGSGKPDHVLCTFADITEQKRSEIELRNAERIQRLVLSSNTNAFVLMDLDYKVIMYNNVAAEYNYAITGQKELKYKYYPDCIMPEYRKHIIQVLKKVENGKERVHDWKIPLLGEDKWFKSVYRPVWDENQKIIGIYHLVKDITQEKLNAEALRKTQNRFRAIFNSTYQFMAILSPSGQIEEVNETFMQFTGNSQAKVKGKYIWETSFWDMPEKDKIEFKKAVTKAFSGLVVRQEIEITGKSMSALVDFSIKQMHDTSGKCIHLIVEGRPIDEQRKAEKDLVKKEMQFTSFMNNTPAAAWITDEFNIIRYVNPTSLVSFGVSDNVIGQTLNGVFPAHLAREYINANHIVFRSNKPLEIKETFVNANGVTRTLQTIKFPLGQDNNGVKLVGGVAMDITQVINTKKELRILNERYEYARRATSDAIWDWDIEKNTITLGEASTKLFGCSSMQVPIETRIAQIHPEDSEKYMKSIREILQGKKEYWQLEYRFKNTQNKYRIISDKAYIIRDDKMKAVRMIGAMQDITDQRKLETKLVEEVMNRKREVVKAIIKAQETERKEISHELHDNLCQILVTCKLYIDVYLNEPTNLLLLKDCYSMLVNAIDETRNLSHSLTPAAFEEKGLFSAAKELIEKLNNLGKIHIRLQIPDDHLEQLIHPEMKTALYRIIQEQLNNTIKHANATRVDVIFSDESAGLCLMVSDNGIGFNINKIKKGLGLNNIISRVSLFAGQINFDSSPGKGCKMKIWLPYQ